MDMSKENGGPAFMGTRVHVSPYIPKKPRIKLSPDCPVGDKFRAEFDQWLLDRFGADEQILMIGGDMYMGPKVFAMLAERSKP